MKNIIIYDIEIEVLKKKIKNINLSVHPPDGRVRLSVPDRMNSEDIRIFVLSKLSWIEKHREKFKNQKSQARKDFISGESHYFFGRRYILKLLETNGKQYVEIKNNKDISLYSRPGSSLEQRERLMIEWYRQELKSIVPEYIKKWEAIVGVKVEEWGVKRMKTRWGSCNIQAKRIWINLELAKKNPICLEYIIVHEMVHILERKHNDRFRSYMDKFLPNWRSIEIELNKSIDENSF